MKKYNISTSELIRIIFFVVVFIVGVSVSYYILKPKEKLKIFNPADLNPALVDSSYRFITKKHKVDTFQLISQTGQIVTQKTLEDKIYVTDFFFTTCQSICPKMTSQMSRVYKEFENNEDIMLLSHTVMPEIDSAEVLSLYADQYGADSKKWLFVTGNKKHIYDLARKSYFVVSDQGNGDDHDFIHTENFVLVDKSKRLRGFYDGTSKEDVDRLINEIYILLEEYKD